MNTFDIAFLYWYSYHCPRQAESDCDDSLHNLECHYGNVWDKILRRLDAPLALYKQNDLFPAGTWSLSNVLRSCSSKKIKYYSTFESGSSTRYALPISDGRFWISSSLSFKRNECRVNLLQKIYSLFKYQAKQFVIEILRIAIDFKQIIGYCVKVRRHSVCIHYISNWRNHLTNIEIHWRRLHFCFCYCFTGF